MITYRGIARLRNGQKMQFDLTFNGDNHAENIPTAQDAIRDHIGRERCGAILIDVPLLKESPEPARA